MSMATTAMIKRPMTIRWMNGETPMRLQPFSSTAISSAPIVAPAIVPRPPVSEAPPITTAAMTRSSYSWPPAGLPERIRAESIIPASPAQAPEMTYTDATTSRVGIPARNAAWGFPPCA
jgi:hypothetical protein